MKDLGKKEKIIQSATRLFSSLGFRGTTLSKIAGEAGIGKGTIYYYYNDKNEILLDCYMRHIRKTRSEAFKAYRTEKDILVKLRKILRYLSAEIHHDSFVSSLFEEYKEYRIPEIEKCFTSGEEESVQLICTLIREGQEQGYYAHVPLPLTAFMLVRMIFAYELDYEKTEKSDLHLKQLLRHMLKRESDPLN